MSRPTECLYYLVSRATLATTAALRQELAAAGSVAGIRPSYLGVLMVLWLEDGLQASVLGRRAGLEPSSMTSVLDRMERDALIRREADAEDRRAQRIFLTDTGRRIEADVLAVVDRMLARATDGISASDLETTKATLQRMLANGRRVP